LTRSSSVELAEELLREAHYDLKLVKLIVNQLRCEFERSTSDCSDEVFYLGRRALYMLQQALEKATKAFLVCIRPTVELIDQMIEYCAIHHSRISNVERTKEKLQRKIRNLIKLLEPKSIGHDPHKTIEELLNGYLEILSYGRHLSRCFEALLDDLEEVFNRLKEIHPDKISEIEDFKCIVMKELYEYTEQLRKLPTRIVEKVEVKKKEEPPCVNKDKLRDYKALWEGEIESNIREDERKFLEARNKLVQHRGFFEELIKTISDDRGRELAESFRVLIEKSTVLQNSIEFSLHLIVFVTVFLPCLRWYVDGGRYPVTSKQATRVIEKREEICMDIQSVIVRGELCEEVEGIIQNVGNYIKVVSQFLKSMHGAFT
jgi:hypothetical protein